jgi:transcriptional regulator with XRE-family HTH domain
MMTAAQCRAARALLDWSQQALADAAQVGNATIRNFESGKSAPQSATLQVLRTTLESAGVIFVAENGEGAGVRLRKGMAPAAPASASIEQVKAGADHARRKAVKAADRALSDVDASSQEKAERRGALTDEPALIAKARGRGRT